jgi:hypothetical protein
MSIKFIDGFDQYQGQAAQQLLSSLSSAGYAVSSGLGMNAGRKEGTYALELLVATGVAGKSWSVRTNNAGNSMRACDVNAAGHYIVAGLGGKAVYSDDSLTWLPLILGVSTDINDMRAAGNTWVIVGAASTILRSTDGRNFARRPAPAQAVTLNAIDTDGLGNWLAVGSNGANAVVWKSTDDGVTWTPVDLSTLANTSACQCVRYKNGVWMIGMQGFVLVTPDLAAWNTYSMGPSFGVISLDCDNNGLWYAVRTPTGASTTLWRSTNNGSTWADSSIQPPTGSMAKIRWADGRWIVVGNSTGQSSAVTQIGVSDDGLIWEAAVVSGITAQLQDVMPLPAPRSGWIAVGRVGTATAGTTPAILVSLAPATTVSRTFAAPAEVTKFTVGFAHMANTRGKILSITGVVDMDWPSFITMGGVNGQAIPARNVWYYYEVVIDKTAKTAKLYINNTLDLTCPLTDAQAAQTSFTFVWQSENGAVSRIDDIVFVDNAAPNGETTLDRIGPVNIDLRLPTSDAGPNAWSPSTPGAEHWTQVGLLPPSQESFIRSATSGAQDLFLSNKALPDGAGTAEQPILAVGVVALAMKGDIDNRQLGLVLGAPGATQKEIIDTTLSVVPEYSYGVFEKAPGNVAWDAANVVSTPFGVAVRP